jgi:hypothetical protein
MVKISAAFVRSILSYSQDYIEFLYMRSKHYRHPVKHIFLRGDL